MERKRLHNLIIVCCVSVWTILWAATAWASTAVVQGSVVNLRSGPGESVVGQLTKGDRVQVLKASGEWSQVIYNNGSGTAWIHSSLIKVEDDGSSSAPADSGQTAVVTASVVNLRSGPGTSNPVVMEAKQGTHLPVVGQSGDWLKVRLSSGQTAWVAAWLVRVEGSAAGGGSEAPSQTAVITGSKVNLRSGAGTSNAIVAEVGQGTRLPVVGKSGDWVKVSLSSGENAWVAGWLVRIEGTGSQPTPAQPDPVPSTPETPPVNVSRTAVVTDSVVKVRSGPGTSHAEVTQVSQGSRFPILDVSGHWVKIRLQSGQEAWVAGWLIRVEGHKPADPPPVPPAEPDPPANEPTPPADPPANDPPVSEPPGNEEEEVPPGLVAVIKSGNLDIRSKPGTRSSSIAQATAGFKLPIVAQSGDWYKVKLPTGSLGWVPESKVSVVQDDQPSRGGGGSSSQGPWSVDADESHGRTQLTIESPAPFEFKAFTLSRPDRLVIDLIGVSGDDLPADINLRSDAVSKVRTGWQSDSPPTGRVVCDLTEGTGFTRYRTDLSSDRRTLRLDIWTVEDVLEDRIILLDPGHGGGDPGATGPTGFKEKDFNLPVALETARLLRQDGAEVVLTRTTDIRLGPTVAEDLEERSRIANAAQADLFVSIHANANLTRSKGGTSVYYHAHPENHTDCVKLARALQNSLVRELGRQDLGVFGSNFLVLRGIDMPGALVETAFISNYEEESLLRQSSFQKKAAAGIVEGIRAYYSD